MMRYPSVLEIATSVGFFGAAVALMIGCFVALVDPYGHSPLGFSVIGKDTPKAGRAQRDRLVKPLDILAYQPTTIYLGTSRTKQAIDPSLLNGTRMAPAYNAGVDRASLGELRALLNDTIKSDHELKFVFIELFFLQFLDGRPSGSDVTTLVPSWEKTVFPIKFLTPDAVATARETISAEIEGRAIEHAVRADGMQRDTPVHAQSETWAQGLFDVWQNKDFRVVLNESAFQQVDAMRTICEAAAIKCVFYLGPISPPVLAALHFEGRFRIYLDWKQRIARYGDVLDFGIPGPPFWEIGPGRLTHWADTSHFSTEGGAIIVRSLAAYAEGKSASPGVVLTSAVADRDAHEWGRLIAQWLSDDPNLKQSFEKESAH